MLKFDSLYVCLLRPGTVWPRSLTQNKKPVQWFFLETKDPSLIERNQNQAQRIPFDHPLEPKHLDSSFQHVLEFSFTYQ